MDNQKSIVKPLIITLVAVLFIGTALYALYRNGVAFLQPHSHDNMVTTIADSNGWYWAKVNDNDGTAVADQAGVRLTIVKTDGTPINLVYYASQAHVVEGRKYVVEFIAKSDQVQTMRVVNYRSSGLRGNVPLTNQWKLYSYPFTATKVMAQPSRLPAFMLGATHGNIWIRNVTVKEAD